MLGHFEPTRAGPTAPDRLVHNPAVQRHLFAQLVGLSALWGASFLFIRIASPSLGPLVMAALRVALACLALAVLMHTLRHAWPWRHWRALLLLSVLSIALPFALYAWAALQLPAGYSALLNTTSVVFGTLSAAWLREDTLTLRKLLGCVLGFIGVAFIVRLGPVQPDAPTLLAAGAAVLAAACYGLSAPLMKRATRQMEPLSMAALLHLMSLVLLLPGAALTWPQAQFTPLALGATAVLGVVTSGLAFWAHLRIIRQVSPVAGMSPAFMIPVFGVAWGHLALGEPLGSGLFVGGGLVLVATALVTGFNPLRRGPLPPGVPDATP